LNFELLKKKKILYVEDDTSIVASFSPILQKIFHTVYIGHNGIEGLSLLKKYQDIDFIISDIKMAKMDGLTMYKEIQKLNTTIPCILITANAEEEYQKTAKNIGIYDYILKPLDIQELLGKVIEYFEEKED
jgi:DNA-binding NtrC family response regulator